MSDRAVVQALLVAAPARFLDGHTDQAIAAARRGVELARGLDEEASVPWSQMQLSAYLVDAYLVRGWLDEAQALTEEGYSGRLGSHGRWKKRSGRAGVDGYPVPWAAGRPCIGSGRAPPRPSSRMFLCRSCRWSSANSHTPRRSWATFRRPRKRW